MLFGKNKKTAVALGSFDGLHMGHLRVLHGALAYAERGLLPCALLFDVHPKSLLSETPARLMTAEERERLIAEMGLETATVSFSEIREMSASGFVDEILVKRLGAAAVCCGYNFRFSKGAAAGTAELEKLCFERGIELCVAPEADFNGAAVSSTRIREELATGNLGEVNAMLCRPFSYCFPVHGGDGRGRTLGLPTINQSFPADFAVPRVGVYASFAVVGERRLPSVTNIGSRPTFGGGDVTSETHIIGFSGDLYAEKVRVGLLEYMRGEIKFPTAEALKKQIAEDIQKRKTAEKP